MHYRAPQEIIPACGHQTVQLLTLSVRHSEAVVTLDSFRAIIHSVQFPVFILLYITYLLLISIYIRILYVLYYIFCTYCTYVLVYCCFLFLISYYIIFLFLFYSLLVGAVAAKSNFPLELIKEFWFWFWLLVLEMRQPGAECADVISDQSVCCFEVSALERSLYIGVLRQANWIRSHGWINPGWFNM